MIEWVDRTVYPSNGRRGRPTVVEAKHGRLTLKLSRGANSRRWYLSCGAIGETWMDVGSSLENAKRTAIKAVEDRLRSSLAEVLVLRGIRDLPAIDLTKDNDCAVLLAAFLSMVDENHTAQDRLSDPCWDRAVEIRDGLVDYMDGRKDVR